MNECSRPRIDHKQEIPPDSKQFDLTVVFGVVTGRHFGGDHRIGGTTELLDYLFPAGYILGDATIDDVLQAARDIILAQHPDLSKLELPTSRAKGVAFVQRLSETFPQGIEIYRP